MISFKSGMRLVLDTNVIVAALRSDQGASRQLLLAALDRRFEMLISVPLMLEYESVLTRPEHLSAAGISRIEMSSVLDAIVGVAEPVKLRFLWRPQLKNPADEMVLETAANGQADRIVTFNVRHFRTAAAHFGIQIMEPAEAWRAMKGGKHEEK